MSRCIVIPGATLVVSFVIGWLVGRRVAISRAAGSPAIAIGYFLYRAGLCTLARTHKLLLAGLGALAACGLLVAFTLTMWIPTWSDDFAAPALVLGCLAALLAVCALACAGQLIACWWEDMQGAPYDAAREQARRIYAHLDAPVHGRSGRATLADLRRAGLIR